MVISMEPGVQSPFKTSCPQTLSRRNKPDTQLGFSAVLWVRAAPNCLFPPRTPHLVATVAVLTSRSPVNTITVRAGRRVVGFF